MPAKKAVTTQPPPPRRGSGLTNSGGQDNWPIDWLPVVGWWAGSGYVRLWALAHISRVAELNYVRNLGETASQIGSAFNTNEWRGYVWVAVSGRAPKTVCQVPVVHEWERMTMGMDTQVHMSTIEGLWTGLSNFVRPFRGISKRHLYQYRGESV